MRQAWFGFQGANEKSLAEAIAVALALKVADDARIALKWGRWEARRKAALAKAFAWAHDRD